MTTRAQTGWGAPLLAVVALVVIVVAAAALAQRGSGAASVATARSSSTVATDSPTGVEQPPNLLELQYTCGGHAFSPQIFNEPEFDLRSSPAGVALAEFIESGQGGEEILPPDGFRLAGQDDTSASFVAPLPGDPPYADAHLENDGSGWRVSGWGQCRPEISMPGLGAAEWVLAEGQDIGRTTTTFQADVTEGACASGQSSEGRVRGPLIIYEPDRVVVIFAVKPLPGAQNCQGNPPTRIGVELSEPLGDRQLLDGGTYPFGDPALEPWQR